MSFDLRRCEDGIITDELLFCVDCGTTLIKTLLLDKTGTVRNMYTYESFPYDKVTRMAEANKCKIIVTGAKSDVLEMNKTSPDIEYYNYSEIESIAALPKCLGLERTVVACVGTGTPFVAFDRDTSVHLGGTGVGGGTFIGLATRMIGVDDPRLIEEMAAGGILSNVNIMVGDIYKKDVITGLRHDYTASNFAKPTATPVTMATQVTMAAQVTMADAERTRQDNSLNDDARAEPDSALNDDARTEPDSALDCVARAEQGNALNDVARTEPNNVLSDVSCTKQGAALNDVAMGIHSLVGEVVGSMAGQLAKYNGFDSVVFCGTVCENKIICDILSGCLSIYGITPVFIENPGFGTCFGAIMRYLNKNVEG